MRLPAHLWTQRHHRPHPACQSRPFPPKPCKASTLKQASPCIDDSLCQLRVFCLRQLDSATARDAVHAHSLCLSYMSVQSLACIFCNSSRERTPSPSSCFLNRSCPRETQKITADVHKPRLCRTRLWGSLLHRIPVLAKSNNKKHLPSMQVLLSRLTDVAACLSMDTTPSPSASSLSKSTFPNQSRAKLQH